MLASYGKRRSREQKEERGASPGLLMLLGIVLGVIGGVLVGEESSGLAGLLLAAVGGVLTFISVVAFGVIIGVKHSGLIDVLNVPRD